MTPANTMQHEAPKPAGGKLSWSDVLHFKTCVNCGEKKEKRSRGLSKTFCPFCAAKLPDVVSWHLDTARSNRWYMRWYRFSLALLRRMSG
jgi:hypothetical protein